jgi:hypothetical protein
MSLRNSRKPHLWYWRGRWHVSSAWTADLSPDKAEVVRQLNQLAWAWSRGFRS